MISLRRSALILGLIAFFGVLFTFHEGAKSALDDSLQTAQKHFDELKGSSSSNSDAEFTDGNGKDHVDTGPKGLPRENATFFTLCRNDDLHKISKAIDSVESKFNSRFHYDWVFLNDDDFTNDFKERISERVSGTAHFGKIEPQVWGYPDWIDLEKAEETRDWMFEHNVVYGNLESYHHMCRFQALSFYKHPLMKRYKYAWRVEPGISIWCRLKDDPFRLMRYNDLTYGFNIAPMDIPESIPTLWNSTKKFIAEHQDYVVEDNLMSFLSDDKGETYNFCHFWTNFEISDLDWLRSKTYEDYVKFLDHEGGFYYERWGDAPIRSIAASLFLPKEKIHFFNDIGYYHAPYGHCPYNQGPLELDCDCSPRDGEVDNYYYDYHKNSCMRRYFQAKGRTFHDQNPDLRD